MAGTLTISTLSDGTNSTSSTNCIQGSAKAWVNFNGTGTVAIRGSYNVSSITDNGVGNYKVNFTTAMLDANYSVVFTAGGGTGAVISISGIRTASLGGADQTTAGVTLYTTNTSAGAIDVTDASVAIFR